MTRTQWQVLRDHVLQDQDEHAAVLMCGLVPGEQPILTCRRIVTLGADELLSAGGLHLEMSPIALARIAKDASRQQLTLVVCHSHPFGGPVWPSDIDLVTEAELCGRVLHHRLAERPVGSLIVGPDGVSARLWRGDVCKTAQVRLVGDAIVLLDDGAERAALGSPGDAGAYDRQLLLWGTSGQRRLGASRVVIVGLGGTGSHVAIQLAHLGVGGFVLVDPDVVATSNLSRIIGADGTSVDRTKAHLAADTILRINPLAAVEIIASSVIDIDPCLLANVDLIVSCTDGHGSRLLLNELSQQFLVPVVDLGIEIQPEAMNSRAGGGVRVLRPGEVCLQCMGVLDAGLVREEFLTENEREIEVVSGYLRSGLVPAPSVVALNGVVASLAVVEVFDLLLNIFEPKVVRVLYRAERRATSVAGAEREPGCYVCGDSSLLGLGAARALPRRQPRAG